MSRKQNGKIHSKKNTEVHILKLLWTLHELFRITESKKPGERLEKKYIQWEEEGEKELIIMIVGRICMKIYT